MIGTAEYSRCRRLFLLGARDGCASSPSAGLLRNTLPSAKAGNLGGHNGSLPPLRIDQDGLKKPERRSGKHQVGRDDTPTVAPPRDCLRVSPENTSSLLNTDDDR